jgi:hypothetical protein
MGAIIIASEQGEPDALVGKHGVVINGAGQLSVLAADGSVKDDIAHFDENRLRFFRDPRLRIPLNWLSLPLLLLPGEGELLSLQLGDVELDRSDQGYQVHFGFFTLIVSSRHATDQQLAYTGTRGFYADVSGGVIKADVLTVNTLAADPAGPPQPPLGPRSRISPLAARSERHTHVTPSRARVLV